MKILLIVLFLWAERTSVAVAFQESPPPPPREDRAPMGDRPPGGPERARRMGPERRPPRPPEWSKLPEEEREAVNGFMQEHFPRRVVDLDRVKEASPQRYERRMARVAQEMRRMMDAQERDPRRATAMIRERQVSFQLQDLARSYHKAGDDDERARVRKSVRELAGKEFDNRLERRQMEVRELETKLAELKTRLEETESVREQMVERRTRELLDPKAKRDREEDQEEGEAGPRARARRDGPEGERGPGGRDDRGERERSGGPPDRRPRPEDDGAGDERRRD